MVPLVRERFAALQQKLIWLSSRATLRERGGFLVLLIAAIALLWMGQQLPAVWQVVLWALWLVALAVLLRRGWGKFFGPVFLYDLVRSARRSNFALLRSIYAFALLFVLFLVYSEKVQSSRAISLWDQLWTPGSIPVSDIARIGQSFFYTFACVQFVAVFLLTPICAAGAITEEKERRTLEYLLTTDLYDREIVLGKLASRLGYLALFILTGLPILGALQLLGGVDPNLVIAVFAATGLTMVSLTALSIANSVYAIRTRSAVLLTYLWAGGYLLLTTPCFCALQVGWITGGNIIVAATRVVYWDNGATDHLLGMLVEYAIFHIGITVACIVWASSRLRVWLGTEGERPARKQIMPAPVVEAAKPVEPVVAEMVWTTWQPSLERPVSKEPANPFYPHFDVPLKHRPPVGEDAMLWKELHAEPLLRLGPGGETLLTIAKIFSILLGGYVILLCLAAAAAAGSISGFTSGLVRYIGTFVSCLMWLAIGLRAAGTITSERDRQTFDNLLTSTLENRAILLGKGLGSILCVRKAWLILGPIWGLGLLTGGLHLAALPLLVIAWAVYAAFVAGLGMWFSLVSRSTLWATVATLLAALLVGGGHWAVFSLVLILWFPYEVSGELRWIHDFEWYGLTPPVTLNTLAFYPGDFLPGSHLNWRVVFSALGGVLVYALLAAALWGLLLKRFGPVTGRMPIGRAPRPAETRSS
jgi:ABC-type transport system involved in multi-copper enzyme maturation permease subunit